MRIEDPADLYPDRNPEEQRDRMPVEHGIKGYRRGCKCLECKAGFAEYMREYNAARRRVSEDSFGYAPVNPNW